MDPDDGLLLIQSFSIHEMYAQYQLFLLRPFVMLADKQEPLWRHQMKTFSASLPFVRGIHWSPVNSPHKGQWRGAFMSFFICALTNSWVNNREAGDLRRHRTHYDVTVMANELTSLLLGCAFLIQSHIEHGQSQLDHRDFSSWHVYVAFIEKSIL